MQGLIKHDLSKHLNFGDSLFYVAIEIEGQLLYLVSVNKNDYIYWSFQTSDTDTYQQSLNL